MGKVTATAEKTLTAGTEKVVAALSDYPGVRSRMLTEHFSEYDVRERGTTLPDLSRWTSWGGMLFVFSL